MSRTGPNITPCAYTLKPRKDRKEPSSQHVKDQRRRNVRRRRNGSRHDLRHEVDGVERVSVGCSWKGM